MGTVGGGFVPAPSWVPKVVEDEDGSTVKVADFVYVLHAFQKKSKGGIRTPQHELKKVRSRLRDAESHYAEWKKR
jgi:hypothetical protein